MTASVGNDDSQRWLRHGIEWHRSMMQPYEAAVLSPDAMFRLMAHALDYLTASAPARVAAYALVDPSDRGYRIGPAVIKVDPAAALDPGRVFELYIANAALDPLNAAAIAHPRKRLVTEEDAGDPRRTRAKFTGAYLKAIGCGPSVRVLLHDRDHLSATITLRRGTDEPTFSPSERRFLLASHEFLQAVDSIAIRRARAEGNLPEVARAYRLSDREQQIAQLVIAGLSNVRIAEQLMTSSRTVARHLQQIYAKLGIRTRSQLAASLMHPPER